METLQLEMPTSALAGLECPPEDLSNELGLEAAATWHQQGKVSQEIASQIAGLDRTDFLLALARMRLNSFHVDLDDLAREIERE